MAEEKTIRLWALAHRQGIRRAKAQWLWGYCISALKSRVGQSLKIIQFFKITMSNYLTLD